LIGELNGTGELLRTSTGYFHWRYKISFP